MKRIKIRKGMILILMSVSMLLLVGWSRSNAAPAVHGVTDTEVVIGQTIPLSGPAAAISVMLPGEESYFKYINEKGGINGRKIKLIIEDDQFVASQTVAKVRKLIDQDKVFCLFVPTGTGPLLAIKDYLIQNNILVFFPSTASSKFTGKYIFKIIPTYTTEGQLEALFAVENLKAKKIALCVQNDDTGKEVLKAATETLAAKYNLKPVAQVLVDMTAVDLSAEALKLRDSGAELVINANFPKTTASLINSMAKIGYKPKILLNLSSAGEIMFDLTGPNIDGAYSDIWIMGVDSDEPKIKLMRETVKKYYPNENITVATLDGWNRALVFCEVLKRAGRNLTVDSFVNAMYTLKNWNEGMTGPLTYTPTQHEGNNHFFFRKANFKAKKWEKVTDWMNP